MLFGPKKFDYDLIILGSGTGATAAAHDAHAKRKKVAIFEKDRVGGDCPNYACVPTKSLLHAGLVFQTVKNAKVFGITLDNPQINLQALQHWKQAGVSRILNSQAEAAFQKKGIAIIKAKAEFVSPHAIKAGEKTYTAAKFLIATGSKSYIPDIPGLELAGYITYREAINMQTLPKSILIYGGGAIACEFAQIFTNFATRVTMITRSDRILTKHDPEVSQLIQTLLEKQGVAILTNTTMINVEKRNNQKSVYIKQNDKASVGEFDEIFIGCGKVTELGFAPEKAGLHIKDHHLVVKKTLQTNVPHIYAAGDVAGPFLLTNTSAFQSSLAARNMFTREQVIPDYSVVPQCVFLSPEVATVGIGEADAKAKKIKIKKAVMPLTNLARASTSHSFYGFVKIITNKKGVILGGSIVAPHAGEMIHEIALAIKCGVTAEELSDMIHVYPTYSEAIAAACKLIK